MIVSPAGDRVFVAGGTVGLSATNALTGAKLWDAKLPTTGKVPGQTNAPVADIALSPDGNTVYAVGDDVASNAIPDYTVPLPKYPDYNVFVYAYDAATGQERWRREIGLPGIADNSRTVSIERAGGIVASPDGRRVYVTGTSHMFDWVNTGRLFLEDVLLVGLDAATGQESWKGTWGNRTELEWGLMPIVSPDSRTLYIAGEKAWCDTDPRTRLCPRDIVVIGVRASNPSSPGVEGSVVWATEYDGGLTRDDQLSEVRLASDGGRLYLTESTQGDSAETEFDFATIAMATSDGAELWEAKHPGTPSDAESHRANGLAVSPSGDQVFVTGQSAGDLTIAYDAATGAERWKAVIWPDSLVDGARSVEVSPDGNRVYVLAGRGGGPVSVNVPNAGPITAPTAGPIVVAYDASDGEQLWVARGYGSYAQASPAFLRLTRDGKTLVTAGADWFLQAYEVPA